LLPKYLLRETRGQPGGSAKQGDGTMNRTPSRITAIGRRAGGRGVVRGSIVLLAGLACLAGRSAFGQLNSNTVTITLNATLAESISVSATPSTVSFTLVAGGTAVGSAPVAITTTWVLASSRANVVLDGYFASSTAALSGSASPVVNIPSSEVYGLMSTGSPTTYTAFSANTALGPTGAGLLLFTQALTSTNRNSNRTDNLSLEINLSAQPQLPAASNYTGSLFLQAQAL
jgi:hypothetical protein